jgi:hypothetical protein
MKDFDTARHERRAELEAELGDRAFVLGGETFNFRAVTSYAVLSELSSEGREVTSREFIGIIEQTLAKMLEPGQEERLFTVLHSEEDPLTFQDLLDLVSWITEQQTERPTQASSPSMGGGAPTSITSTDASSSRPVAESVA